MFKWQEKMHLYITVAAALTMTVNGIVSGVTFFQMAVWVSLTIVAFYTIGQLVRYYINTKVFPPQDYAETYGGELPEGELSEEITELEGEAEAEIEIETEPDEEAVLQDSFLDS